MAARSGTCAMCAAGWEGGEEADWRGGRGVHHGGVPGKGQEKSVQHPVFPSGLPPQY